MAAYTKFHKELHNTMADWLLAFRILLLEGTVTRKRAHGVKCNGF